MAKIWPVYDGREPTRGGPWAELPVSEAIDLFGLRAQNFISDLDKTPRYGDTSRDLTHQGFKRIVVEIEADEAKVMKWKPGFYKSSVRPINASNALLRRALAKGLGQENLLRVETEPYVDHDGKPAIRVRAVIAAKAHKKITSRRLLDALDSLQEQLNEMRDDRAPVVDFATEAELSRDDDSQF